MELDTLDRTIEAINSIEHLPNHTGNHHRTTATYKIRTFNVAGEVGVSIDDSYITLKFVSKPLKKMVKNWADEYVKIQRSPEFQDFMHDSLESIRGAYRRISIERSRNHANIIMKVRCKNVTEETRKHELENLIEAYKQTLIEFEMYEIWTAITGFKSKLPVAGELHVLTTHYTSEKYNQDNEGFANFTEYLKKGTAESPYMSIKTANEIKARLLAGERILALPTLTYASKGGTVRDAFELKDIEFLHREQKTGFARYNLILGESVDYKINQTTELPSRFPTKFVVV